MVCEIGEQLENEGDRSEEPNTRVDEFLSIANDLEDESGDVDIRNATESLDATDESDGDLERMTEDKMNAITEKLSNLKGIICGIMAMIAVSAGTGLD